MKNRKKVAIAEAAELVTIQVPKTAIPLTLSWSKGETAIEKRSYFDELNMSGP